MTTATAESEAGVAEAPRMQTCYTCGIRIPEAEMFGPGGHHEQCTRPCFLSKEIPPLFERQGRFYNCMVGAVPSKIQEKVHKLVQNGAPYWTKSSRPFQKGKLFGVGGALSAEAGAAMFPGTSSLKPITNEILEGLLDTPMAEIFEQANREGRWSNFIDYIPPPLPSPVPGVASLDGIRVLNAYVGLNYMHVRDKYTAYQHGPPPPVAKFLGTPSCVQTCPQCKISCVDCKDCCIHLDDDESVSVLIGIQDRNPPIDQAGFFVMGDHAFPLAGGRAFLFDGRRVPHGVWCLHGRYTGMAFVAKDHKGFYDPGDRSVTLPENWVRPPGPWPKAKEFWKFNGFLKQVDLYRDEQGSDYAYPLSCRKGIVDDLDRYRQEFDTVEILEVSPDSPMVKVRGMGQRNSQSEGWIKVVDDSGKNLIFDKTELEQDEA